MNTIKVEIEVENQIKLGLSGEYRVNDMVFTDLEYSTRELNAEELIANLKAATKSLKGFKMLTITLYAYDRNDYTTRNKSIASCRFICDHNEVKMSKINFNKYDNFQKAHKKDIDKVLRAYVEQGNTMYHQLKQQN